MTIDLMTGLVMFSFVSSITPGPNNIMLMASGANHGFRLTIPHMLGVTLGFVFMVFIVGIGIVELFELVPTSYVVLKFVSVAYLLYLAWKIATTKTNSSAQKSSSKPFSFIQSAAFQWVNPKAWSMALTSVAVYAPEQSVYTVSIVALVFGVINIPCIGVWTVIGEKMQHVLAKPTRLQLFNYLMALLLIASLIPVLQH